MSILSSCLRCGHTDNQHGGGIGCEGTNSCRCPGFKAIVIPQRIQRKRTKGWRMPEGAVYVGRPTKWGNPWRITVLPPTRGSAYPWNRVHHVTEDRSVGSFVVPETARKVATTQYYSDLVNDRLDYTVEDVQRELAGHDLACWCPPTPLTPGGSVDWLGLRCHAEVLIQLANGGTR